MTMEEKFPKLVSWWDSESDDFRHLVLQILAALPGGETLEEDLGIEPMSGIGWVEIEILQELFSGLQDASDVEQVVNWIMGQPSEFRDLVKKRNDALIEFFNTNAAIADAITHAVRSVLPDINLDWYPGADGGRLECVVFTATTGKRSYDADAGRTYSLENVIQEAFQAEGIPLKKGTDFTVSICWLTADEAKAVKQAIKNLIRNGSKKEASQ